MEYPSSIAHCKVFIKTHTCNTHKYSSFKKTVFLVLHGRYNYCLHLNSISDMKWPYYQKIKKIILALEGSQDSDQCLSEIFVYTKIKETYSKYLNLLQQNELI